MTAQTGPSPVIDAHRRLLPGGVSTGVDAQRRFLPQGDPLGAEVSAPKGVTPGVDAVRRDLSPRGSPTRGAHRQGPFFQRRGPTGGRHWAAISPRRGPSGEGVSVPKGGLRLGSTPSGASPFPPEGSPRVDTFRGRVSSGGVPTMLPGCAANQPTMGTSSIRTTWLSSSAWSTRGRFCQVILELYVISIS
jgi:hypothetical protein